MDENDPILEEIRRIREQQFAECGYDIRRLMERSMQRQYTCGHDIVARSKTTGQLEVVFKGSNGAVADKPVRLLRE